MVVRNNPLDKIVFKEFYLFNFFIDITKLRLAICRPMTTKKEKTQNKMDVIDRFLSILWRKEVGDLKYTTK